MRVRHKNGHWIWCECTVSNFLHEPSILALVSNFRDISESKKAQFQREFDNSNLDALINNTTDLMWSVDKDFNLITFNKPFEQMVHEIFGASVQKGGSAVSNVFPVSELPRYKEYYQRAFDGETFTKVEHVKFPVELWAEISFNPIREGDKVVGTACHSRDITDKKKTIHQLKKSEAFNRGILRSLSSHIAVIDGVGNIIAVNEAWQRFAKENGDPLLQSTGEGMNYLEVCRNSVLQGEMMAAEVIHGILDVLEDKRSVFYLEYPCHTPEKLRWFAMRALKFDGEETMVVITHQDITERKLSEERLIEKNHELEKTNAELDRFVYSASHDLRAPLTSILGLVNLLESESKEEGTLLFAEMIKKSIQRLDGFIKNIINYSKNNRQEILIEKVDVTQTLNEAVESLRYMEEFEKVIFEINILEEKTFFSDVQRLRIMFENIISNALKFIDNRKSNNYVKIIGKCDSDGLKISFEDNGIGIPLEYLDKIFQMFFRVSGKIPGAGIGLYIVKEALTKLYGEIHVESKEGKGTIFNIIIKNHTV
jgi:PAS domain S-box-containing protein